MTKCVARLIKMESMDFTMYLKMKKRRNVEEIRVNTNEMYHSIKRLMDICFSLV